MNLQNKFLYHLTVYILKGALTQKCLGSRYPSSLLEDTLCPEDLLPSVCPRAGSTSTILLERASPGLLNQNVHFNRVTNDRRNTGGQKHHYQSLQESVLYWKARSRVPPARPVQAGALDCLEGK